MHVGHFLETSWGRRRISHPKISFIIRTRGISQWTSTVYESNALLASPHGVGMSHHPYSPIPQTRAPNPSQPPTHRHESFPTADIHCRSSVFDEITAMAILMMFFFSSHPPSLLHVATHASRQHLPIAARKLHLSIWTSMRTCTYDSTMPNCQSIVPSQAPV
jgi:hypothetical protein